jgi:hypothetical protein
MNGRRAAKLRTELQEALQGVDDFLADVITRADTELKEFDAPYLRTYRIYRISLETLHGEVAHHVGYASDAPVYILDGQSDELVELAHTDHVTIDSAVLGGGSGVCHCLPMVRPFTARVVLRGALDRRGAVFAAAEHG